LPKGSIIVFDRGYYDFATLNRFSSEGITWVTRRRSMFAYDVLNHFANSKREDGIISDQHILLGNRSSIRVEGRIIKYCDPDSGEVYEFLTNNLKMGALTVTDLYRKRWQIELLFKRMKQNYPLKYFLGDSENAIKIQIWCSLIADLLLKIVKKGAAVKWSFSNLAAMVRLHLMTYIDLFGFLRSPEKALKKLFSEKYQPPNNQLLFIT